MTFKEYLSLDKPKMAFDVEITENDGIVKDLEHINGFKKWVILKIDGIYYSYFVSEGNNCLYCRDDKGSYTVKSCFIWCGN